MTTPPQRATTREELQAVLHQLGNTLTVGAHAVAGHLLEELDQLVERLPAAAERSEERDTVKFADWIKEALKEPEMRKAYEAERAKLDAENERGPLDWDAFFGALRALGRHDDGKIAYRLAEALHARGLSLDEIVKIARGDNG